jgi:hypothetical protein
MSSKIQEQVRLPFSVAFAVVMQGIRIRFGRSLVTIMGVVLGIAFLMSILTGQIITDGVQDEKNLRQEVKRMYSFLIDEMGPPDGKVVGVIQQGDIKVNEYRLIQQLGKDGLESARLVTLNQPENAESDLRNMNNVKIDEAQIADLATPEMKAIIVLGTGTISKSNWNTVFEKAPENIVLAHTAPKALENVSDNKTTVMLERELSAEEIKAMKEKEEAASFRSLWIVIISLLVTVIGIANAMLMSVTERFREIGTMKCLGALSRFVRTLFLIEASIMGIIGSLAGSLFGFLFTLVIYSFIYGLGNAFSALDIGRIFLYLLFSLVAGVILSIVAALYPAHVASDMVPADALRTNI